MTKLQLTILPLLFWNMFAKCYLCWVANNNLQYCVTISKLCNTISRTNPLNLRVLRRVNINFKLILAHKTKCVEKFVTHCDTQLKKDLIKICIYNTFPFEMRIRTLCFDRFQLNTKSCKIKLIFTIPLALTCTQKHANTLRMHV